MFSGRQAADKITSHTVEFYHSWSEKIKKLPGYQSGKHFLPKYYSKSLEEFVRNIAVGDIETSMREITDRLREILKPGVNEFQYEVSPAGGGVFEAPGLTFDLQCGANQDNLNEAVFTARLALTLPHPKITEEIFSAFPFSFTHAAVNLPTGINLKDFIAQLENHHKQNPSDIQFYYDPNIQYLELRSPASGKQIVLYSDHFEVFFSDDFQIMDLLKIF